MTCGMKEETGGNSGFQAAPHAVGTVWRVVACGGVRQQVGGRERGEGGADHGGPPNMTLTRSHATGVLANTHTDAQRAGVGGAAVDSVSFIIRPGVST
mmetsp:Transcript_16943/g.39646  ORF Transcript_16943/g.39646 Transcript_16943/m.39646 type:complete len:98 (+) Transcript_16943:1339-1632(+)